MDETTAGTGSPARSIARRDVLEVVVFVIAINVVGGLPGVLSGPDSAWFRALEKPAFYPPEIAFPVVWTLLFTLMGVALWLVWRASGTGRGLALGLFVGQMAVNVAWTPVFFGLEELFAGLVVIVTLWVLVAATIVAFRAVDRRAAALLVPYLLWVTFASVLNYELWRLNA
ncbi:TspO/MBR family protein [Natrialbaceae archaeon A-CW3]